MPTKTCKRISNQRAHLFPQSETELFPVEICRQMASVLDISDPGEIARLHGILNDPGSFAYLATYLKKAGVPNGGQRASLKNLSKLLEKTIKAIDEPDWQIERVRRCRGRRPHDLKFVGSGRAMDADRGGSDTTAQKAMEEFRRYAETYRSKQGGLNFPPPISLGGKDPSKRRHGTPQGDFRKGTPVWSPRPLRTLRDADN
jgi:hypothetical protein